MQISVTYAEESYSFSVAALTVHQLEGRSDIFCLYVMLISGYSPELANKTWFRLKMCLLPFSMVTIPGTAKKGENEFKHIGKITRLLQKYDPIYGRDFFCFYISTFLPFFT